MSPLAVRSEDDLEEDETVINDEQTQTTTETETDEETGEDILGASPFARTQVLFVQPESSDLPAGRLARLLVGFRNNGSVPFLVETIEGSFRYPQDFSYVIQNFSTFEFNKVVESEREATFDYYLTPSEVFSSRQFGLTINLRYKNADGKAFVSTVFNETINVVDPDEGLDGETFFLYVFLAALLVLLFFGAYQFLSVFKKKGRGSKVSYTAKVSNGNTASSSNDVDFEWIPKEHLQTNKSPKVSPRQRNAKGANTSGNSSNDEQ